MTINGNLNWRFLKAVFRTVYLNNITSVGVLL